MDDSVRMILATPDGKELKFLSDMTIDIEIGSSDDTFQLTFSRAAWDEDIEEGCRVFIPNTEYGGRVKRKGTATSSDEISVGGLTWRGMMDYRIIQPASGKDYATASGDLNEIIKEFVEDEFPGLFYGVDTETGVTLTNYQFDRYCTLHDGLQKMLKESGYRLDIQYIQGEAGAPGYVQAQALEIIDYSDIIELSEDSRINYTASERHDCVNHLICLGSGDLAERTVIHLYVGSDGSVGTTQYYTGLDEVVAIYDYAGANDDDLKTEGIKQLESMKDSDNFAMDISELDIDSIAIGDIVGGRDYLTGMSMSAPIVGKIYKVENGEESIEFKLEE